MAKVKIKDEKSLEASKEQLRGTINFRITKCGVVAAKSKWPRKKKMKKIQII
jgi:hypothetical protein